MNSFAFSNLGVADINGASKDITISVGGSGSVDSLGDVETGLQGVRMEIECPGQPDGDLPLLRVANASTGTDWKMARDQEDDWPRIIAVMTDQQRNELKYDGSRIFVDRWQLLPSDKGQGFVEVLVIRVSKVERTINEQGAIDFRPRTI